MAKISYQATHKMSAPETNQIAIKLNFSFFYWHKYTKLNF